MNAQALDLGEILCFVKKRFVPSPANGQNLFDVETSITMQVKQVKKNESSSTAAICDGIPSW